MTTKLSYPQLEALWIQNGGSATTAPMAAAIAMAESGGCIDCPPSGTNDWGLWQINKGGPAMLNANANARTAIQMSQNGQNWRPWCTAYSDAACGTRGGQYLGSASPFWKFLQGKSSDLGTIQPIGASADPSTAQGAGDTGGDCVWKLPSVSLGPVNLGGQCLISRSQGRALLGGVSLVGGGLIMLVGAALLLAGTRAGRQILTVIPNPVAQGAAQVGAKQAADRDELAARRRDEREIQRAQRERQTSEPGPASQTRDRNTDAENRARAQRNAQRGGRPPVPAKVPA